MFVCTTRNCTIESQKTWSRKKYTGEEYSKEYQELINTYRQMQQLFAEDAVEDWQIGFIFIYLKHDDEIKDGTQRLNIDQLRLILREQLKTSDGMFRTVGKEDNPLHLIWKNAKLDDQVVKVGDKEYEGIASLFLFDEQTQDWFHGNHCST